jgi:hypothetical protein
VGCPGQRALAAWPMAADGSGALAHGRPEGHGLIKWGVHGTHCYIMVWYEVLVPPHVSEGLVCGFQRAARLLTLSTPHARAAYDAGTSAG